MLSSPLIDFQMVMGMLVSRLILVPHRLSNEGAIDPPAEVFAPVASRDEMSANATPDGLSA
jgi:hypothetical protein